MIYWLLASHWIESLVSCIQVSLLCCADPSIHKPRPPSTLCCFSYWATWLCSHSNAWQPLETFSFSFFFPRLCAGDSHGQRHHVFGMSVWLSVHLSVRFLWMRCLSDALSKCLQNWHKYSQGPTKHILGHDLRFRTQFVWQFYTITKICSSDQRSASLCHWNFQQNTSSATEGEIETIFSATWLVGRGGNSSLQTESLKKLNKAFCGSWGRSTKSN